MEEFIHQQNLDRYRKILAEKTHEPQRQTIMQLLAEEETRATFSARSQTLQVAADEVIE
jgi:hypothetical protein